MNKKTHNLVIFGVVSFVCFLIAVLIPIEWVKWVCNGTVIYVMFTQDKA